MKPLMILLFSLPALVWAGPRTSVNYTITPETLDSAGQRTSSANYVNDGSLGLISGFSEVLSPPGIAKHGYIGQLTETVSLSAAGTPSSVNEGATSQLSGTAVMDDDTVTALDGSEIAWNTPAWPLQGISAGGVATAATVYGNTAAPVSGQYLGVSGSGSLLVLNTLPDNYGSYAGDGLPDSWQNQYFGLNNPDAAPGIDLFGTGENNFFKYVAGLDPTNSASRFMLSILTVTGQPGQKQIVFSPRWSDRTYTPLFSTNLVSGAGFTELSAITTADNGAERTVTDTNATAKAKFYRVRITLP